MSARPTTAELHQQSARAAAGQVKVALPAYVLSYDRDEQRATIQIAISYRVVDDRGEETHRARPPVPRVPVQWQGATWDLEAGDWGLAVFCDRSIDEWLQTGETSVEPADSRRFDVSDAVFLPGLRPFSDPLPAAAIGEGAVVLWDRGTSDLRLGSASATAYVALDTLVRAQLEALETALQAAVTAGIAGAVGGDGGAAALAALQGSLTASLAAWPATVAATKVKAL